MANGCSFGNFHGLTGYLKKKTNTLAYLQKPARKTSNYRNQPQKKKKKTQRNPQLAILTDKKNNSSL